MVLFALVSFLVLSGLFIACVEPIRQARQHKAEQREKREQADAAQRKKAELRQQGEKRQRRERMETAEGFESHMETMRARDSIPLPPLKHERDRESGRAERLSRSAQNLIDALPGGSVVWRWVAAAVVGGLWAVAFSVEILIDQRSFVGLGHGDVLSNLLAVITALIFSLLGLVISDLVGFTRILPLPRDLRRITRAVLVIDLIAILAFGLSLLPPVMRYRSAPDAAAVQRLEQNQRVLSHTPGTEPQLEADVSHKLAAAKEKLDTSHYADQRLGIGAALLEAMTSWGAIWLGLMGASAILAGSSRRARRRSQRMQVQLEQRDLRFQADVAAQAEELGITPEQLRRMLVNAGGENPPQPAPEPFQADAEPPPASPPPPPPAPEEPRRQQQSDPPADGWPAF